MRFPLALLLVLAIASVPTFVRADTPANCTYADFLGKWTISVSAVLPSPSAPSLACDFAWSTAESWSAELRYPNAATLQGARGNWTLIYNQGIEIWTEDSIAFALAAYDEQGNSYCGKSQVGWVHGRDGAQWRCMALTKQQDAKDSPAAQMRSSARKNSAHVPADVSALNAELARKWLKDPARLSRPYRTNAAYLAAVNKAAKGQFTVRAYPEFEGLTIGELERMRGVPAAEAANPLEMFAPVEAKAPRRAAHPRLRKEAIPASFDWRNVSGVNYVSPVRSQGSCGSCYAFASAGMLEARIRVRSQNRLQPVLSTQDVVSCSLYSQGCEGGFPYLVAGKYGRDYGLLEEGCAPYKGSDSVPCDPHPLPSPTCNPQRWRTAEYYYIGGYYGQSTPQLMQEEIMANGPIAVSFEVYPEFHSYSGGVYSHQFALESGLASDEYNPFELTNHVVVIVGWGVTDDAAQTPFWTVRNSWGPAWGEQGYFRILRSLDKSPVGGECAIESLTVSAIPILH